MSKPTAGWDRLGSGVFYRKVQLYTAVFETGLELADYHISGAPYGGALGKPGSVFLLYNLTEI